MLTTKNKIWKINKAGNLDRLQLQEESISPPEEGEVRVNIKAVGLNFADIFACLGLYSATPAGSFTPGLEFSGMVESDGHGFQRGDRILGVTRFGAYTTHININHNYIQKLPVDWSFAQGAAFPAQSLTAWYAIKTLGNIRSGQVVLVHSGAGGVGMQALKMLDKLGCKAVATVGSPGKIEFLREQAGLPEAQIILRDPRTFRVELQKSLKALGAGGYDLVLDAVAGKYFRPGYEALNSAGRLVLFGAADMTPSGSRVNWFKLAVQYLRRPRLDPLAMISDNKSMLAFNLIWLWERLDLFQELSQQIEDLDLAPPFVGHEFPFEQAKEAQKFFQSGKSVGKVVLLVGE